MKMGDFLPRAKERGIKGSGTCVSQPGLIALLRLVLLTAFLCFAIASAQVAFSSAAVSSNPPSTRCGRASPCPASLLADATLMQQGRALYDVGKFEAAIAILQQAVQTDQSQGNALQQAIALSNLALAYQQVGQWQNATDTIADSLSLLGKSDPNQNLNAKTPNVLILAQVLDIQGDLQSETGQAEQAIATWQQTESIYKQLDDVNGLTQSKINQAQALRELGYYLRVLTTMTELGKTLKNQSDSIEKVTQLRSLENAFRLLGNLDKSHEVLQQSLNTAKRLPPSQELSQTISAILYHGCHHLSHDLA